MTIKLFVYTLFFYFVLIAIYKIYLYSLRGKYNFFGRPGTMVQVATSEIRERLKEQNNSKDRKRLIVLLIMNLLLKYFWYGAIMSFIYIIWRFYYNN